ncbi:hypothetical protein IAR55_006376 [Kwoniella newhampshirensis]|uniref:Alpha/beta-hydrolase n=1 Tax=Kwoniella newhampshirensis TaxID=1651941 RepID=A0AAW0YH01_9TREE
MSSSPDESAPLLDHTDDEQPVTKKRYRRALLGAGAILLLLAGGVIAMVIILTRKNSDRTSPYNEKRFFHDVVKMPNYCDHGSKGYSGYIGLATEDSLEPKRSFFLFSESELSPQDAPLVLTVGGGPGTSGQMRYWNGDGPCRLTETRAELNPYRWTKSFNYLSIDYPVGAGFSHGAIVNSSADAAKEMYDFIQKFYVLFPNMAKNQLVLNGGSYGGMYLPHMANEIVTQNDLQARKKGVPGARHVPLESIMISNPYSDPLSHAVNGVEMNCKKTNPPIWNSTQCEYAYQQLPAMTQYIRTALDIPTLPNKLQAAEFSGEIEEMDLHGVLREDYRKTCNIDQTGENVAPCLPFLARMQTFLRNHSEELGVPDEVVFQAISIEVNDRFWKNGDRQVDVTYRVGMVDLNCPWTGVLGGLLLSNINVAEDFKNAEDIPWPGEESEATVRVVGEGAGDFTYVQLWHAGHFVSYDMPRIEQKLVEHWIKNKPFGSD